MAKAPGHRLGQIVGDLLEEAADPPLREFADARGLFLDRQGPRAARSGKKVKWIDGLGNAHDLDFVLERDGSEGQRGTPLAFIELAWRRYTKHSRAKAQEIQGAVLPLIRRYSDHPPFAGAIIAGNWTPGALTQMRSSGFGVVHVSYEAMIEAFAVVDVDIDADEGTGDAYLSEQVDRYEALSDGDRDRLVAAVRAAMVADLGPFFEALRRRVERQVVDVEILPLFGSPVRVSGGDSALAALGGDAWTLPPDAELVRFELRVAFDNGDVVSRAFDSRAEAAAFLARIPGVSSA